MAGPPPGPPPPPPPPPPPGPPRPATGRRRRWIASAAVLALLAGALLIEPTIVFGVPVLFALVVPFEKLFPRHEQKVRRPGAATDISYLVMSPLLGPVGIAAGAVIGIVSLMWLPGLAVSPLVGTLPSWLQAVLGILLFDVIVYWAHRWSHEVPFLWRFHALHHSPERLDWISGFRAHPLDGALIAPAVIFLLAAGFDPQFAGALAIVQLITGLFLHANVRWRWRPLHRLVITPEFHHWHHANEPDALNSNYSVFLPVWDMVFGSYFMPRERRPQVYGISQPTPTHLADQLRDPLRGLVTPWWVLRHPLRAVRRLAANLRRGMPQLWASARRPRRPAFA